MKLGTGMRVLQLEGAKAWSVDEHKLDFDLHSKSEPSSYEHSV